MTTVLVVSENDANKIELGHRLERKGYTVRFRYQESDWTHAIERTDPDVILVRSASREENANGLVRKVTTQASKSNIPVVTLAAATGKPLNLQNLFCRLEAVATDGP